MFVICNRCLSIILVASWRWCMIAFETFEVIYIHIYTALKYNSELVLIIQHVGDVGFMQRLLNMFNSRMRQKTTLMLKWQPTVMTSQFVFPYHGPLSKRATTLGMYFSFHGENKYKYYECRNLNLVWYRCGIKAIVKTPDKDDDLMRYCLRDAIIANAILMA